MLRKLCAIGAVAVLPWVVACDTTADSRPPEEQKASAAQPADAPAEPGAPANDKTATATDNSEKPAAKAGNPISRMFTREPEYKEVTLPAGTALPVELQTTVSSETSNVEDAVSGTLRRALVVDGLEVLPAGSTLSGVVTDAKRSGRVKGRAHVALRFTSLRARDERLDIRTASIGRTAPATKKQDAAKIGIGAGAGAVIGGIVGGGDGAAKGAAIGGAGGTGVVLATRGQEVTLPAGSNVSVKLAAPVTVRVPLAK